VKRGDLVRCVKDVFTDESSVGVILTRVRLFSPEGTVWEVLYSDGIEYWDENDLEVINESR